MKILTIIIIIALIFFVFMLFGINSLSWRNYYSCDIGEDSIAGDYELTSSNWYNKWFNQRSCAIEDCSAYNKYQKEIGSKLRCVV